MFKEITLIDNSKLTINLESITVMLAEQINNKFRPVIIIEPGKRLDILLDKREYDTSTECEADLLKLVEE